MTPPQPPVLTSFTQGAFALVISGSNVGGGDQNISMTNLADTLRGLGDALAETVDGCLSDDALRVTSDDDLLVVMSTAARLTRLAEALVVEATAQVLDRSDSGTPDVRLTTRKGCRSAGELVQRITRTSRRRAADVVSAARAVQQRVSITTGELLPPEFPGMRAVLARGDVGVDGVVAVAVPLRDCPAGRAALAAADEELAASARGEGVDGAPPAPADDLRAQAAVWAVFLDQDGSEPREARALRKRGLTLGVCRDGLVPVRGDLLPEVAAQLQRGFDSLLNPKVDGTVSAGPRFVAVADQRDEPVDAVADDRTRMQRQHDALAILLTAAASASLPSLGGAAPVLVVSVREQDLATGRGRAHVSGSDEPLSLAAARHIACAGAVQRVVSGGRGRIVSLGSPERVFTYHQRRAIALRDGGCLIPGCHVPAEWCEIHHVEEHARGGPTHTDNGVMLCWFHHRTLDSNGWRVRMNHGIPEVRGPAWWDSRMRWRPITKSPARMRDRLAGVP